MTRDQTNDKGGGGSVRCREQIEGVKKSYFIWFLDSSCKIFTNWAVHFGNFKLHILSHELYQMLACEVQCSLADIFQSRRVDFAASIHLFFQLLRRESNLKRYSITFSFNRTEERLANISILQSSHHIYIKICGQGGWSLDNEKIIRSKTEFIKHNSFFKKALSNTHLVLSCSLPDGKLEFCQPPY